MKCPNPRCQSIDWNRVVETEPLKCLESALERHAFGWSARIQRHGIVEHRVAVEGTCPSPNQNQGVPVEHVEREIVAIGPYTHMWVIGEIRALRERIPVVLPGGIVSGRDRRALEVR